MVEQGLISVIVPVYNVEEYLDRCVESIVCQTYSNIEILLIDDGSDDHSGNMCDRWAQKDSRIRVFHKKNGGLSSARNLGLKNIMGGFVTFVDSDDYIDLDMYETMMKAMNEDVDVVSCGTVSEFPSRMKKRNQLLFMPTDKKKVVKYGWEEGVSELLLTRSFSFSVCDKLFRRHLFEKVYFPVGRSSEDLLVVFNIFLNSRNFVNIGWVKYHYVFRDNSICRQSFFFRRIDYAVFAGRICKDIKLHYPQFKKQAEAFYIRSLVSIIQKIQACENRKEFSQLEMRLKKALFKILIESIFNYYITKSERKYIIKGFIFS